MGDGDVDAGSEEEPMQTWAKGLIVVVFVIVVLGTAGTAFLSIRQAPPPPSHSYVVAIASSATSLEEDQTATITATFTDNSSPVSAATVSLDASPADAGAIAGTGVGTTDANGRVTFSYRAARVAVNTTVTLTAAAIRDTTTTTGTGTVLVVPPSNNGGPQPMGVFVTRSADGTNWVLHVVSTPPGKAYTQTYLTLIRSDGTTNLTSTPLSSLAVATSGCSLQQASGSSTTVSVGDRILCQTSWYVAGTEYRISDSTTVLAAGELHKRSHGSWAVSSRKRGCVLMSHGRFRDDTDVALVPTCDHKG